MFAAHRTPGPDISLAFHLDLKLVAVSEVGSGILRYHLPDATASHGLSFSADGRRLATSHYYTAYVWDLEAFAVK